jgi:coatomer subunit beta'
LDIKKKLSAQSERVKSVDLHPSEPWVLAALYSGNVMIWDYESGGMLKSFEVSELPVRCAKFVARKQWFLAASDDMRVRVFNYNTMEKIKEFEAHADYIRSLEVHPSLPYMLSSSDDMTIKLWDWDRGFDCTQIFEGHAHYVMQVKFNPKDTNTFASASLDRSIKVWGLGSHSPHYTLEGHERGVNCIDYYPSGDKPYILSGADDQTVKIWDYQVSIQIGCECKLLLIPVLTFSFSLHWFQQTKSIVHSLDGHTNNVCAVMFHPKLPIIASASEDGTVRIWQSTTYRAETALNYGMERAWALAASASSNKLAIGFDEGVVCIELGSDEPVASMDSTGKVVWATNNEIQTTSVKGVVGTAEDAVPDGERLVVVPRDLGSCELYPQMLRHNCNGRFVAVCGDGEFIIYTSQALRNKAFGQALDFVWSGSGTGDYCIRESTNSIKIFKNFKESQTIVPATASAEGLFGGHMIGVKGGDGSILFYDWDSGEFVQKIEATPKEVYWSDAGNMVLLACADSAFVLSFNAEKVTQAISMGQVSLEDGIDGSFDLLFEIGDTITSGKWVGDCFLYVNNGGRLNYSVGGQIETLVHLETSAGGQAQHSVLGYLAKEDRVFLIDKSLNLISYKVTLAVLQYQTAVMRGDFDAANVLLPNIPEDEYTKVARFLESQGFKEEAFAVTTDPDHKFDLALELGQIETAHELLVQTPEEDKESTETQSKWKRLSDAALKDTNLELCEAAGLASDDFSDLLMLYSAVGNLAGVERLAELATAKGKTNVGFVAHLLTGNVEACADILVNTNRLPEAALFVRTYLPSKMEEIVALWKEDLASVSETAAQALAAPSANPEFFPDLSIGIQVEQMFLAQREQTKGVGMASIEYPTAKGDMDLNLIELIKGRQGGGDGESKQPEPADEPAGDDGSAEVEAGRLVEEEAARKASEEEAARKAAEEVEAAILASEEAEADSEAGEDPEAAEDPGAVEDANDFGEDW